MSQPYIGEIRMFGGNFAPQGWAFCDGSVLNIADNTTLFTLIGTTYGGDGQQTFALPDLRSRIPAHVGPSYSMGQAFGEETVRLTVSQLPAHTHVPQAGNSTGDKSTPAANVWAASALHQFSSAAPTVTLDPAAVGVAGGSQPHDNMSPYLVINFIISLFGIFPSQG
jgi:microcystin-dependent protein